MHISPPPPNPTLNGEKVRDRLSWYLLALPGTALPGGYRMHHGLAGGRAGASVGDLVVALPSKTGTGRAALTWLRVSLLPQERPGLNGSFMGQWEASLLAGIPHTPPCPVWGLCCLAPFIVYPQLASSGMWLLAVPPQVPATLDHSGEPQPMLLVHGIFTEGLSPPFRDLPIILQRFPQKLACWHCLA